MVPVSTYLVLFLLPHQQYLSTEEEQEHWPQLESHYTSLVPPTPVGEGGRSGTVGGRSPAASLLGFYPREAFQSQIHTEEILYNESHALML